MDWIGLLVAQLTEPFRIGLLAALLYTTIRLRHETGFLMPLAAGLLFFAVLLPNTLPQTGFGMPEQMLTGVAANLIIMGVLVVLWLLYDRVRRGSGK